MYLQQGDAWAIAASWAGKPKHPVWYLNLMAHPDTTIEIGGREIPVRARKLEAYFQTRGIPFHFIEMNRTPLRACARATGIAQLPCVQEPDGRWLSDTTPIMAHFEAASEGPRISPVGPAAAFLSLLLEDLFDEWYWRPALYYR